MYSKDKKGYEKESDTFNTIKKYNEYLLGVVMILLSVCLLTINNIIIKKFSIVISDILIVRSVIQVFIILLVIYFIGDRLLPRTYQDQYLTICQGLAGGIAFVFSLTSLNYIGLPDWLCIIHSYTLLTLLAIFLQGPATTSVAWFSATLLYTGVFLITQPSLIFHHSSWSTFLQLVPYPGLYGTWVAMAVSASIAWTGMTTLIPKSQVKWRKYFNLYKMNLHKRLYQPLYNLLGLPSSAFPWPSS